MDIWIAAAGGCSLGIVLGMGLARVQVWQRRDRGILISRSWRELVERYGQ